MARVPKDKYKNNPPVSIDGARVRAAIAEGGYSVMGVARAIGEDHRTLDSIVQGKQARTRKRRLKKLSKFLNVSETWLSGEEEPPLGGLPPWDLGEPATLGDYVFHLYQNLVSEGLEHEISEAPFYQLAWARMVESIVGAWKRDIEDGIPEARSTLEKLGKADPSQEAWSTVAKAVQRLTAIVWLQAGCLLPPGLTGDNPISGIDSRENRIRSADVCARAASEMLNVLLGPWFEGRRRVDYGLLLGLIKWSADMIIPNRAARISRMLKTEV